MSRRALDPLYARLTGLERALAVWETCRAGREPEPALWRGLPWIEVETYERTLDQLGQMDVLSRAWLLAIARTTGELETLDGWLATLQLVDAHRERLGDCLEFEIPEQHGTRESPPLRTLRRRVEEVLQGLARLGEAPVDPPHSDGAASLMSNVRQRLRRGVQRQWQELRAIDAEVEHLAEAVTYATPLHPDVDALRQRNRERLEALAERPGRDSDPIPLPEPDDDLRAAAREMLRPLER